jgi:hypothetical protein
MILMCAKARLDMNGILAKGTHRGAPICTLSCECFNHFLGVTLLESPSETKKVIKKALKYALVQTGIGQALQTPNKRPITLNSHHK